MLMFVDEFISFYEVWWRCVKDHEEEETKEENEFFYEFLDLVPL